MSSIVDLSKCVGCGRCVLECQPGSLEIVDGKSHFKDGARCLECGHCVAVCPNGARSLEGYSTDELIPLKDLDYHIDPNQYYNYVRARRCVRQYKPDAVPEEIIRKIVEVGRYTQTGANIQPLRFIVLSQPLKRQIAELAIQELAETDLTKVDQAATNLPMLYFKYQPLWQNWYRILKETGKDMLLHDAPHQMIVVAPADFQNLEGMLSLSRMEIAMNGYGLGSCFTGFATLAYKISDKVKALLGIQAGESVVISMDFGYPNVEYYRAVNRKPANLTLLK